MGRAPPAVVANGAELGDAVSVGTGVAVGAASAVWVRAAENVSMAAVSIWSWLSVAVGVPSASPPPQAGSRMAQIVINCAQINLGLTILSPFNASGYFTWFLSHIWQTSTLQNSYAPACYNPTPMHYLDYSATTPVDSRVLEAMTPYFSASFGNPSSVHRYGQAGESAIASARETAARVLNCKPGENIFTSCGSESDNLAIRGAAYAMRGKSGATWILASRAEHPAGTKTLLNLEK